MGVTSLWVSRRLAASPSPGPWHGGATLGLASRMSEDGGKRGVPMSTLTVHPPGVRARVPVSDAQTIERSLQAAYARERIEELVGAILEDVLSPSRIDLPPWHDDAPFKAGFALAVREVSEVTADLLAEHLTILLETAPPRLAVRLAAAPRFVENS